MYIIKNNNRYYIGITITKSQLTSMGGFKIGKPGLVRVEGFGWLCIHFKLWEAMPGKYGVREKGVLEE